MTENVCVTDMQLLIRDCLYMCMSLPKFPLQRQGSWGKKWGNELRANDLM